MAPEKNCNMKVFDAPEHSADQTSGTAGLTLNITQTFYFFMRVKNHVSTPIRTSRTWIFPVVAAAYTQTSIVPPL